MYTVARFLADTSGMGKLVEVGEAMNALRQGVFTGLRKRGDGFACEVCEGTSWPSHERAIGEFVTEFAGPIQQARSAAVAVAIDIALEVEDRERAIAYVCISFAPSLLLTLSSAGVRLVVTSY
jgi:hypothetical protein